MIINELLKKEEQSMGRQLKLIDSAMLDGGAICFTYSVEPYEIPGLGMEPMQEIRCAVYRTDGSAIYAGTVSSR